MEGKEGKVRTGCGRDGGGGGERFLCGVKKRKEGMKAGREREKLTFDPRRILPTSVLPPRRGCGGLSHLTLSPLSLSLTQTHTHTHTHTHTGGEHSSNAPGGLNLFTKFSVHWYDNQSSSSSLSSSSVNMSRVGTTQSNFYLCLCV